MQNHCQFLGVHILIAIRSFAGLPLMSNARPQEGELLDQKQVV